MEGPIRPRHHPRPLAVVSRMSADRLWLAHGRLWLTLPKTLQVLTFARLSPAHGRLWLTLPKTLQVLTSARLSPQVLIVPKTPKPAS